MSEKATIYDIASTVGNSESKALLFGAMKPRVSYSTAPLHREFMDMQDRPPVWTPSKAMPQNYCPTFESAGLVTESEAGASTRTHRISKLGLQIGKPLVGHLLDVSAETDVPLLAFFGPSCGPASKNGLKQSEIRVSFMRMLIAGEGRPHSVAESAEAMSSGIGNAGNTIESMEALGLVAKVASGRGKPTVVYKALPGLMDIELRTEATVPLLHEVAEILKKHFAENPDGVIDNHAIASQLRSDGVTNMSEAKLIQRVGKFTDYFATRRKVLDKKRDHPIDNGTRTSVQANDAQLELMNRVVGIVDGMADPSDAYTSEGAKRLEVIMSDKQMVNQLLLKGKKASIGPKATDEVFEQNRSLITELLLASDKPLTTREIRSALAERGVNLSQWSLTQHVKQLLDNEKAQVQKTRSGRAYSMCHRMLSYEV